MASVVGLFVSPAVGQPMQTRTSVRAFAGRGLEGDRYERGEGSYSKLARMAARHVSLIAREAIEAANGELVQRGLIPFEMNETRRNIVIDGVDVYGLLGKEFRIGAVRLRGSEPTRPCHIPSAVAGKTGFAEAYRAIGAACGPRSSRMELFRSAIPFKRINCLVRLAEHIAGPRNGHGAPSTSAAKTALVVAKAAC